METQILETVLREILEDLREIKQQQATQIKSQGEVVGKVEAFDETIADIRVQKLPAITHTLAALMNNGINEIKHQIELQPKSIVRQFRFLLFPEHFADNYYKIVFGRLLFWMMIFLIATYLFVLGKHLLDNNFRVRQNEVSNDRYKKAWQYLYKHENTVGRRKMENAWSAD